MSLIDWILNLAGLFLWVDWRSGTLAKQPQPVVSLASAVRPAEQRIGTGRGSLAGLLAILLVRPCFYYTIGSKLMWTPKLDLFSLSLPWRSDLLDRMYLYSTISFLLAFGFLYSTLFLLSGINRAVPDSDPIQRFIRLQLGWLERIPWFLKFFLPSVAAFLCWSCAAPIFGWLDLLPDAWPQRAIWGEALAFAVAAVLSWKWTLLFLLFLHLLNFYVYLGTHPIWNYIGMTSRRLLKPLSFLTLARIDLAPVAGAALVLFLSEFVVKPSVIQIFRKFAQ